MNAGNIAPAKVKLELWTSPNVQVTFTHYMMF